MELADLQIYVPVTHNGAVVQRIVHNVSVDIDVIRLPVNHENCTLVSGVCPTGVAWADKAYAADYAHQPTECSNAGICNRETGTCQCFPGFTGNACQRSKLTRCVIKLGSPLTHLLLRVQVRVLPTVRDTVCAAQLATSLSIKVPTMIQLIILLAMDWGQNIQIGTKIPFNCASATLGSLGRTAP